MQQHQEQLPQPQQEPAQQLQELEQIEENAQIPQMAAIPPAGRGSVGPPPPPPPFTLGPAYTHNVLLFDDPIHGAAATKLYNKVIELMDTKFDSHADNLASFWPM